MAAGSGAELADKPLVAPTGCKGASAKEPFQAHRPKMTTTIARNAKPATKRQSRFGSAASLTGWLSAAVNSIVRGDSAGEVAASQEEAGIFAETGSGCDTGSVIGAWMGSG